MEYVLVAVSSTYISTLLYFFFSELFEKKPVSALKRNLLILSLIACDVLAFYFEIPLINEIVGFITTIIMFRCLFKHKSMYYILVCALLNLLLVCANIISTVITLRSYNMHIDEYKHDPDSFKYFTHFACFIFVLTLMYMAFFVISKKKISSKMKLQEILFYVIVTLLEWILLQFMIETIPVVSRKIGISITIGVYLFVDVYISYLMYKISQGREAEAELSLIRQQANIQLAVYSDLQKKYQATRSIVHDIKNHVRTLEELIEQQNSDTAKEYTVLLNKELEKLVPQFVHNNQILSVIINDNLFQAQKMKIKILIDIEDVNIDFISDLDITAVFANLLDNARDACAELPEEMRRIKLVMKTMSNFLIINVSNPYRDIVEKKDGSFSSTKKNHEGIGIYNIRNTVNKYDGDFTIATKDNQFIAKITIPYFKSAEEFRKSHSRIV